MFEKWGKSFLFVTPGLHSTLYQFFSVPVQLILWTASSDSLVSYLLMVLAIGVPVEALINRKKMIQDLFFSTSLPPITLWAGYLNEDQSSH
jgi:NhaP-type Na+/H+ or K+/H+ antiporter